MTGAAPGLALEVYEWAEAFRFTTDYATIREVRACLRTKDSGVPRHRPYRQRTAAGEVDCLSGKSRACLPTSALACLPEFLGEDRVFLQKGVVVFKTQAEEGVGLNEGTSTGDNLGAAVGDEVESRELLKNANGVGALRTVTAL